MDVSLLNTLLIANTCTLQQSSAPSSDSLLSQDTNFTLQTSQTTDNVQDSNQESSASDSHEDFSETFDKKISDDDSADSTNEQADNTTESKKEDTDEDSEDKTISEYSVPQELLPASITQDLNVALNATSDNMVSQQIQAVDTIESLNLTTLADQTVTEPDLSTEHLGSVANQTNIEPEFTMPEMLSDAVIETENNQEIIPTIDTNTENGETILENEIPIEQTLANASELTSSERLNTIDQSAAEEILPDAPVLTSPLSKQQSDNETTINSESESAAVLNESDNTDILKIQASEQSSQQSVDDKTQETTSNNVNSKQNKSQSAAKTSNLPENTGKVSVNTDKQETNLSDIKSSTPQTDSKDGTIINQPSVSNVKTDNLSQISNNIQSSSTDQSQLSAVSAKTTNLADTAASISSQIQKSVYTSFSSNEQVVINISPPELGKVSIRFSEENNSITGLLQVDNIETKNQIQKEMPDIIQNLQDSGVSVKKIEVVLTNQQEQQTMKEQSSMAGQNNWSGQQNTPNNPESQRSNNSIYNQWTSDVEGPMEISESELQFSGTSINMLA